METYHFQLNKDTHKISPVCFQMPENCTGISLQYDLEVPYTMLVLLMIKDEKGRLRFQKQLSYSNPIISLSNDPKTSTLGAIPGEIGQGQWTIEAVYNQEYGKHFDKDLIEFKIDLSFEASSILEAIGGPIWVDKDFNYSFFDQDKIYQKGKAWYKGDFHTHTQLSDGKELIPTVTEKVLGEGLDFYYATEHNLLHTGWQETELMVLPGMEMTTNFGHANVFGMTKRPESLDAIINDSGQEKVLAAIDKFIKECNDNDWYFSINHPFLYQWKWQFDELSLDKIRSLEIINDPTYELEPKARGKLANQQAVDLSDFFWSEGYRICAIGGSDSHLLKDECYPTATTPSVPGDPATWVLMDDLTPNNLKKGLAACHTYVTRFCQLDSQFTTDDNQVIVYGDKVADDCQELHFDICIEMEKKPYLFYKLNGQEVALDLEKIDQDQYRAQGKISFSQESYDWIRFGANTQDGDFRFYGNPITRGEKTTSIKTFGQAKEKLGLE